jgi:diguanylate cyclase
MQRENLFELYAQIIDSTDAAIAIADARLPDMPLVFVNPAFETLTGYTLADVYGKNCRFLQGDTRDQSNVSALREAINKGASARVLLRNYRKDGSMFWNDLMISPMHNAAGELTHYFSVCLDASKQVLRADAIEIMSRKWSALLDASLSLTFVLDTDGKVVYESGAVASVTGFPTGTLIGKVWTDALSARGRNQLEDVLSEMRAGKRDQATFEAYSRHADGHRMVFRCIARNALDHPQINGIVIAAQDITAQKTAEAQLVHDALHDQLTGLGNRAWFANHYQQHSTTERSANTTAIVWLLDLDQFKALNDSYGHTAGDDFLRGLARNLQTQLGAPFALARLGGDEFAVMAFTDTPGDVSVDIARTLLRVSEQPIQAGEHWVSLSASVGIAMGCEPSEQFDTLLRNADVALYKAKANSRNNFQMFEMQSGNREIDRLALRRDLPHALTNGELRVFYQPIVDGRSGKPITFEMLLRWQHPRRGLLSADQFISELDVTGLCEQVTQWVLREGCKTHRDALAAGTYRLALNVWSRSFKNPDFAQHLAHIIGEFGLPPSCIEIEITEGDFVLTALSVPDTIRRVAEHGMRIVIDDFGKGFSNFNYLIHFPIHAIKIDREFVQKIGVDPRGEKLLRILVSLATDLEMDVVAEGVETEAQREFMLREGCHVHQGYLYGRAEADARVKPLTQIIT